MNKEIKVSDKKPTVKQPESLYSRNELIGAAVSFGVKPEVMAGALKLAGKNEMTRTEAERAVKRFLERKV